MLLAVDIGNSNIVLGGYGLGGGVRFCSRLATQTGLEADQMAMQLGGVFALYNVQPVEIEAIAISSVVPALTPLLLRALAHHTPVAPHLLSPQDAAAGGVTVDIDNPRELGMDILATALAIRHSRALPAIVVDMGTATKLSAMDSRGHLLGVAIAPGLRLSLNALVQGASALGGIPLEAPGRAIGKNTAESMKSGVVLGAAAMLDGMIDRFDAELGGAATVVATGGSAGVVTPHCRHAIELCETLLLDGLVAFWRGRVSAGST